MSIPSTIPPNTKRHKQLNSIKREAEAKEVVRIVKNAMDIENDLFVVLGDLNDTCDSEPLQVLTSEDNELGVTNALSVIEQDDLSPTSTVRRPRDTHHWKRPTATGERQNEWAQIDYLLCSS